VKSSGERLPGIYRAELTEILEEDGSRGFLRGVGLRGLWSGLELVVYFGAYAGGRVYLQLVTLLLPRSCTRP